MISAEVIERDYRIIHNKDLYDPEAPYEAVATHTHWGIDTSSRVSAMVDASIEAGFDAWTVNDHDSLAGYERVLNVVEAKGYKVTVYPGVEVTARGPKDEMRHVLAYGVQSLPRPGLSPAEVNAWAHNQPAVGMERVVTVAAHPELLGFSIRREEWKANQQGPVDERFDFGEMVNGEAISINAWRDRHRLLSRVVSRKLPDREVNENMQGIVLARPDARVLGGNDSHNVHEVRNVVNLVPFGMTIFDAALEGKVIVAAKRDAQAPETWRYGVQFLRGLVKERQIQRQWSKAPSRAAA